MKKTIFLTLMACLVCFGRAFGGNVLTVSNAEVEIGGQATMEIGCEFDTEFTAFELQLSLSEGLSLVTDEAGRPIVECGFEGSHEVTGNLLPSNGNYKLVCYSMQKASLPMTGTLIRVTVKADAALQPGAVLSARIVSQEFVRTADSTGEMLEDKDMPVPVRNIQALPEAAGVYDLSGRQVVNGKGLNGKCPRGVYIVGGKKVLK